MAIALVGSFGTPATGTTTATPSFAQSTTAGNLLICWGASTSGAVLSITVASGWSSLVTGTAFSHIFYKANCGAGETAPTMNGTTFTAAVLAEFSGGPPTGSPLDLQANNVATASPSIVNLANPDAFGGELIVGVTSILYSMAATKTSSHAYNNGATASGNANNDATSNANHYRFSYGITTGNGSPDQITDTFNTTNITSRDMKFGSVLLAQFPPPSLVTPRSGPF